MNKEFQGKLGEEYDLFKLACPHYDELEQKLGESLALHFQGSSKSAINVLEIGCASGYTTDLLLAADPRITVTAVDNEPIVIEQAKRNLDDYIQQGRLTIIEADALQYLQVLPVELIDAFASGFTLHNFEQGYRAKCIGELHRVLASGGLFANADKYAHDNTIIHERELQWQLQQFVEKYTPIAREDLIAEWTEHYLKDNALEYLMRENASKKEMQTLGFRDVRTIYRKHMEAVVVGVK